VPLPLVAVVSNAGIACVNPVELIAMDKVKQCFEVNYLGSMRLIQTFLPALRKAGQGARIVQISSIAGLISGPGWAVNLWVGEVLEKSPQPTRDGYREVSLMAAPLDCRGGATADARRHASCAAPQTTRLQAVSPLRCTTTPKLSMLWRP